MRTRGLVAISAVVSLGLGGLAIPVVSNAAPAPFPASLTTAEVGPLVVNQARVTFSDAFIGRLGASRLRVDFDGPVTESGNVRTVSVGKRGKEGYQLVGALTLVGPKGRLVCRQLTVVTSTNLVNCVRGDGTSRALFRLVDSTSTSLPARVVRQDATLKIASTRIALSLFLSLGTRVFLTNPMLGEFSSLRKNLLSYSYDSRAHCEIDNWASDLSINRGWALQTLVNQLPQGVTVSRWVKAQGAGYELVTPEPAQTNVGQRTPKMEGISTRTAKEISSGSEYWTDHYWDGYNYGCNTNAPFVVAPGVVNSGKTWNYDGQVRTSANQSGVQKPNWWAQPRQTNRDSPIGRYSWTCRATPSGVAKSDAWWSKVDRGSGFLGDDSRTQGPRNAGSAPVCPDQVLDGMSVTTKYSITKRGNLEGRNESGWPRGCTTDNSVVGCWEEVYSLASEGWDRAWAYQYHVFAPAMRAELQSDAQIKVPSTYDPDGIGYTKPITWRIVGASVPGAWPQFTDVDGEKWDSSGISRSLRQQNWSLPSEFTVPGDNSVYSLAGYGSPSVGEQAMTFSLVADTDGTWTWPIKQDISAKPLPRPQVNVTLRYTLSNFDDGGSCTTATGYDDNQFGGATDTAGAHCLQGTMVPTLWPLPSDAKNYFKRVHDQYVPDPTNPNNKILNRPNTSLTSTVVKSCYNDTQVKVQDLSQPTAPDVGADYTWPIKVTGLIDSFSSC